jgi:hypothetical protein
MRLGPLGAALAAAVASLSAGPRARADDAVCIAANDEALALRKAGKLREALRPLAVCADPACPAEIKSECSLRIADVGAALPSLTFVVKDRKGNDLTGVMIRMDGAPLQGAFAGQPLPLDPGEHTFRFEAAGQPPLEKKLVLRTGEKDRREIVVLGAPPPPSFWTPQRIAAATLTGAGVVGLGVGAVFAGFAASAKSKQNSTCTPAACSNYLQATEDYDTAVRNATGSTVAFAAGGALAATGIILFLTAPRRTAAPAVGRTLRLSPLAGSFMRPRAGLSLEGSF